ncbi:MAG: ScpA family protein [Patescibacteria group bacterium]|nr:ScpA family protein [Patescibacteria group bacterium]
MDQTQVVFQAKVGEFEGPLGLLLQLIEDRKLHISQVSLATVTDQFIGHVKELEAREGEHKKELADFILVASTLMFIKSVALLPDLKVTTEEAQSASDLQRRLRLYQKFQELGRGIKSRYGSKFIFFRETSAKEATSVFAPTKEITTDGVLAAISVVIKSFPKPEALPQIIVKKIISLEEVISDLTGRVQSALRLSFKDFVKNKAERVDVIVSFLGMLELVHQGIVTVEQQAHFDDIAIETTDPTGVPRYD